MRSRLEHLFNVFLLLYSNRKAFKSNDYLILPHLGYGDMICCLPMFEEMGRRGQTVQVFSPAHAIDLLKLMSIEHHVKFLPIEVFLSDDEFGKLDMIHRALKFGRQVGKPVLFLGQDLWWLHSRIRPDLDLGSFFFRMARIPLSVHKDFNASEAILKSVEQIAIPNEPYVLVDHFPDTVREIDQRILDEIESRGFSIVQNPREVKYENIVSLIENARELHLVNSSLLCFALSLKPKADLKIVYLMNKYFYPGNYFYDHEWQEKALHSIHWERYQSPIELNRSLELDNLILKAGKIRYRFADFVFFRNYPSPVSNQK